MKNLIRTPSQLRSLLLKARYFLEKVSENEYKDQYGTVYSLDEIKENIERIEYDFKIINEKTDFSKPFIICHSINHDFEDGVLLFDIVKQEDFAS